MQREEPKHERLEREQREQEQREREQMRLAIASYSGPRDPEAAGNTPPINHLCTSRDSDERPPDNDPIIPAHAG